MNLKLDIGYKKILYRNVNIEIKKSGIVSFIGENGSGKSTLYKTILGIIDPINGVVPNQIKNTAAVVSYYVNIPNEVKVKDVLNLLDKSKTSVVSKNYTKLNDYIMQLLNQRIKTLSSGQRRLLEIYIVLASSKKIILLDEASNSLDIKNRQLYLSYVKNISQTDILFLHTSHDLQDVEYLGGEVYGLFKDEHIVKKYTGEPNVHNLQKFLGYEVMA